MSEPLAHRDHVHVSFLAADQRCRHEEWLEYRTYREAGWVRITCTKQGCDAEWEEPVEDRK